MEEKQNPSAVMESFRHHDNGLLQAIYYNISEPIPPQSLPVHL